MRKFSKETEKSLIQESLDEILRQGAEKLLKTALLAEIEEFIEKFKGKRGKNGHRQVVRNGYHKEREIITPIGKIRVRVPRGGDREDEIIFQSSIIPPYLRRTKKIDEFIPFLYLKGVSTGDFSEVLSKLMGRDVGLSPGTVVRLKEKWMEEYKEWNQRDLAGKEYVYWWVDGIYFNVRLEDERMCFLIIIGATQEGKKELVAVVPGYRESKISWRGIMLNLKERGLKQGPKLATGDGSLGFWAALREEYPATQEQRCWVHKMANILDKMPKSVQAEAKMKIKEIYLAPTKEKAESAYEDFVTLYEAKYPGAVKCLKKDKQETMAFYDFPAEHWRHIRSINPIESTFATVRLRSKKTKGCGSTKATIMMVFKLVQSAQKRWHRLHHYKLVPLVLEGKEFEDGVLKEAA